MVQLGAFFSFQCWFSLVCNPLYGPLPLLISITGFKSYLATVLLYLVYNFKFCCETPWAPWKSRIFVNEDQRIIHD